MLIAYNIWHACIGTYMYTCYAFSSPLISLSTWLSITTMSSEIYNCYHNVATNRSGEQKMWVW